MTRPGKRLVLFSDGTWNSPEQATDGRPCPTHVVRMAHCVEAVGDGVPQVIYYDAGVGTESPLRKLTGGAFGTGLEENVQDLYRFLVHNYAPGDEIWLFGFSRGAYTARSLAGMVRNCSILKREYAHLLPAAYDLYRSRSTEHHPKGAHTEEFRRLYAHDPVPRITFIGVWDTVGARGIPMHVMSPFNHRRYGFHDTTLSSHVDRAYHAVSIDERRRPFEATLWTGQLEDGQKVEQAWFAGVHSDVGGGYPCSGPSEAPFQWMWQHATDAGLGLRPASAWGCDPLAPLHDSMSFLYTLWTPLDRTIGNALRKDPRTHAAGESVHESALRRWREVPTWRPAPLARYLDHPGPHPAPTAPPVEPTVDRHCGASGRACPLETARKLLATGPCRDCPPR